MEDTLERARKALDSLVYLPSLKGQLPQASSPESPPGTGHPCRTWDRGDLMRRLHSFKAITWFCKPPGAGPVDCARRGWVNVSADMLSCEFCQARLSLPIPPTLPAEEVQKIGREFTARLSAAHDSGCPWGAAACDPSLAAFPPLERQAVAQGFTARVAALGRLNVLPPISEAAYFAVSATRSTRLQQLLEQGPQRQLPAPLALTSSSSLALDSPRLPPGVAAGTSAAAPAANGLGAAAGLLWQQAAGAKQQQPEAPPEPKGSTQPSPGIACHGAPEFVRRQRFLALCGWNVCLIRPGSRNPGSEAPDIMDATRTALQCDMCNARAGLWEFVPEMAGAPNLANGSSPAGLHGSGRISQPSMRLADLSQTIAGGALLPDQAAAASTPRGPFGASPGSKPPAFGSPTALPLEDASSGSAMPGPFGTASLQPPSFGAPAQPPAFNSTPAVQAGAPTMRTQATAKHTGALGSGAKPAAPFGLALMQSAEAAASSAAGPFGGSSEAAPPIFGIAALQQQAAQAAVTHPPGSSRGAGGSTQQQPRQKRGAADGDEGSDGRGGKRARLDGNARAEPDQDTSFSFPILAAPADGDGPRLRFRAPSDPSAAAGRAASPLPGSSNGSSGSGNPPKLRIAATKAVTAVEPIDPLQLHRPFCPWVAVAQDASNRGDSAKGSSSPGSEAGRCGWRWCLDALVPAAGPEEERDAGQGGDQRSKVAALLRKLRTGA